MDSVSVGILAYMLGIVVNVLYPYVTAYLEYNQPFNYKYAISRVLGALIAGAVVVVTPGFLEWLETTSGTYQYISIYFVSVFLTTFGAGSIARETQKFGEAVKDKI